MFVDKVILLPCVLFCVLFSICYCQEDESELPEYEFVANMDKRCMGCLCYAVSGCNQTLTCTEFPGYCGPFKISRVYWANAGKLLNNTADDPKQNNAYEDCSMHYECAIRLIKIYIIKYAKDCNKDGVTDCYDFLMLHVNGSISCHRSLERDADYLAVLQRFQKCWEI